MTTAAHKNNYDYLFNKYEYCPLIQPGPSRDIFSWLQENEQFLSDTLKDDGAILFRGFDASSLSKFNKLAETILRNLMTYTHRSTPRKSLGGNLFTATEYPPDREIQLHNENSYTLSWPGKILFFCVLPAEKGGSTPIADSRRVLKQISMKTCDVFRKKGVMYIRNYIPGIDLSWQEVFQTDDIEMVNKYCRDNHIKFEWHKSPEPNRPVLTTSQVCQGTLVHPITGEEVWFNQAHLFHKSNLDRDSLNLLVNTCGEDNLPRNAFFGDGQPIPCDILEEIRDAYKAEKRVFDWERGDILLLDNVLACHGRTAFSGQRKIAVAMG